MHNLIRTTALVAMLAGLALPAAAATPAEFYMNLLRRGAASYEGARYPEAAKQLRTAAFGLVDAIEQYQLAQMYLALTYDKLGDAARTREAAGRVIVAERVERRYASVPAAAALRSAFEAVAARVLNGAELAMLRGGPVVPPPSGTTRPATTQAMPQTQTPARTATQIPNPATQTPTQTAATTTQPTTPPTSQPATQSPTQPAQSTAQPTTRPVATQPAKPAATTPVPQTVAPSSAQQPKPVTPMPKPATAKPSTTTNPGTTTTTTTIRFPTEPARPATNPPAPRPLTATEISTRLAGAERALNTANLVEARRLYREVLAAPAVDHDSLIRLAEGLYRSRDFAGALSAFTRIGTLRRGEEPYRYYIAVAAYETGDYARAKRELAAALPYIEITPDVSRYRTRIEGAQ